MAFDGIITCAMVHELQDTILLGKIEKVYQPENDELVFHIHTKKGNVKLYASVNSARSCLHFIETIRPIPGASGLLHAFEKAPAGGPHRRYPHEGRGKNH